MWALSLNWKFYTIWLVQTLHSNIWDLECLWQVNLILLISFHWRDYICFEARNYSSLIWLLLLEWINLELDIFLLLLINFASSVLLTATLLPNIFLMQTFFYSNFSDVGCYRGRWNLIEKLFLNICFRHMFAQFRHIEKFVNLSKSYYCIDFSSTRLWKPRQGELRKPEARVASHEEKNHLISVEKGETFLSRIFNKRQTEKSIFKEISKSNHFKWIQTKPGFVHEMEPKFRKTKRKFAIGNCFRAAFYEHGRRAFVRGKFLISWESFIKFFC